MNLALDSACEQVSQRELDRGHLTTPAEVVASTLRLLNLHEGRLQENREAIGERLEVSFEQSRNGETYTPEQARQTLAPSKEQAAVASRQVLLKGTASAVP